MWAVRVWALFYEGSRVDPGLRVIDPLALALCLVSLKAAILCDVMWCMMDRLELENKEIIPRWIAGSWNIRT
jgi:hypothetical protein